MTAQPSEREAQAVRSAASERARPARPRVGFLGVGWIGRHRMEAIVDDGAVDAAAIADLSDEVLASARAVTPQAVGARTLDELCALSLDGIVVATPSALHATQARAALERGIAVFCQKPLARSAAETAGVVEAARSANRLLGVDLSYRHTQAMQRIYELVGAGELGHVYAIELVFHNAYGPDKVWFRDVELAGGGCVIDLGTHLVDLVLWTLGFPRVARVTSALYAQGKRLPVAPKVVEDYAIAELHLETEAVARLACSWNLSAGCDAIIEAHFHGTRAGASFRNVNGSFYDFVAERYVGTRRERLVEPPDAWGGRAAVAWARQLAADGSYDATIEHAIEVARVLDAIYGR
jgi:predicted dehydrogenase